MNKKKIFIIFILSIIVYFNISKYIKPYAKVENEYLSYQEIILSSGKLIKNYTDEEKKNLKNQVTKPKLINIIFDSVEVEGSYIANTTELIENNSDSEVKRVIKVTVETNHKVTFSSSGSITSATKGQIKTMKSEVTSKAGIEYSSSTTKSVKEVNEFEIIFSPKSQYMVVVEGRLRVTNGYVSMFFNNDGYFEIVTIESQFYHYEVRSL